MSNARESGARTPDSSEASTTDLKFVKLDLGEEVVGGWYRELPDAQIEVLSRAQLERVPLKKDMDPEAIAREKISEIVSHRKR